eukprot:NODE_801_length_1896_cov_12.979426_g739_i0.p2 GENE.NODE_801_length_1896_cov_12.979426_g739_i0~~NODE_801_length_1896_cov_12.979426_g739_i0.p2  ORF type:complete len:129 (-),score=4.66 NODE_801_length_1896_cov_12.979426_g739_i0:11-397(-)
MLNTKKMEPCKTKDGTKERTEELSFCSPISFAIFFCSLAAAFSAFAAAVGTFFFSPFLSHFSASLSRSFCVCVGVCCDVMPAFHLCFLFVFFRSQIAFSMAFAFLDTRKKHERAWSANLAKKHRKTKP